MLFATHVIFFPNYVPLIYPENRKVLVSIQPFCYFVTFSNIPRLSRLNEYMFGTTFEFEIQICCQLFVEKAHRMQNADENVQISLVDIDTVGRLSSQLSAFEQRLISTGSYSLNR